MPRSETQIRILKEALHQLNQEGSQQVSIRSIAQALSMSAGNLAYHFKNTDVIIYELYLDLIADIDKGLQLLEDKPVDLFLMHEQLLRTLTLLFRYRFLLLDFPSIARRIPRLQNHFRKLIKIREEQFNYFLDVLILSDFLRPESFPGEYRQVIYLNIILSNAWLSDAYLHFDQPDESVIPFYARLNMTLLAPYLTASGQHQYQQLLQQYYPEPFSGYDSLPSSST